MLSQIEKQILKSWIQYAVEPRIAKFTGRKIRTTGPRMAVIGNCQAFGLAYAMKVMDPSATVHHYSAIGHSRFADMNLLVKTLETYDYVFAHEFPAGHLRGSGDSVELRQRMPRVTRLPPIVFAAFHPDLIYVANSSTNFIFGPLGPYHSAVGLFGWRVGLTLDETRALFNENVFRTLGYLDMWDAAARKFLAASQEEAGVDLSTDLMKWARKGAFMYSVVHPTTNVLFDVAKRVWEKVGLKPPATDYSYYYLHDLARSEIFPIYPPIAKIFGVQGSYLFKIQNHHLANDVGDFLTLPQYLEACFRCYEKSRELGVVNSRVEVWLANEDTKSQLIALARENLRKGLTPTV